MDAEYTLRWFLIITIGQTLDLDGPQNRLSPF